MSFLTERKMANTVDAPIALPSTEIKMSDWVVIATIRLTSPSRLTVRMLNLNFISSTVDLTKIVPDNYINSSMGLCYVALFFNYTNADPSSAAKLDRVTASSLGVFSRIANPFVTTVPGTYTWLAVNNVQYSTANSALAVTDSADFRVEFCKGQIAHYKIPRHIKFVDGFPTTVTGKVQKFAMREAMIAELDLVLEKTA